MAESAYEISLPASLTPQAIDDAIATRSWLLRFPSRLEALFERDTGQQRCHDLIVRAYIGIFIYDLFAFADFWATPHLFTTALWVRLAFFTPLSLALTATLYLSPPAFLRESLICLGAGALAIGTIIYLMAVSGGSPQPTLHESMILVVLFLTVVERVRFWYLLPTCLASLLVHIIALEKFYDYPIGRQVATNMVFGAGVIFSVVASYTMERDLRLHYLLSLRDKARNSELDQMSRRDILTGLGNRRALEETLAVCEPSIGRPHDFSVVLIDIDHFKMFNDTAGHQAGDVCLKRVAGIVQAELRGQADLAFRFGGEEFIVVLPKTPPLKAIEIAERMRRAIETAAIPHPAVEAATIVTASFGVAGTKFGSPFSAAEIIASADNALYIAKGNGRNQVWPPLANTDIIAKSEKTTRMA